MGQVTTIGWCDSTVNPTENCDGCELWNRAKKSCYAGQMTDRFKGSGTFSSGLVRFPGRMAEAAKWKDLSGAARWQKPWIPQAMPRLVFISDMSDALSKSVSFEYLKEEVIDVVASWPHIGMWLTKRGKRLLEFDQWLAAQGIEWPANLWAGVSITSTEKLSRIESLAATRAPTVFVSAEPFLERIEWGETFTRADWWGKRKCGMVIIGGESDGAKGTVTPLEWFEESAVAIRSAGVPLFVKQLGTRPTHKGFAVRLPSIDERGEDWQTVYWPESLKFREFPAGFESPKRPEAPKVLAQADLF